MSDVPAQPAGEPATGNLFDDATIDTLSALEDLLDDMRERHANTPQWEFCEGFLTALLCTRRDIPEGEWLPCLLGPDPGEAPPAGAAAAAGAQTGPFASPRERTQFLMHWQARQAQLRRALEADADNLADAQALHPAVLDWRGMALSPDIQGEAGQASAADDPPPRPEDMPAYAQMWAAGFMAVVDMWADDWALPRDKALAADIGDALDCVALLLQDDTAPPTLNAFDETAPPSLSEQRLNDLGEAVWAVHDLYRIARSLGPRQPPARSARQAGRNDPCPCGSGKKYKKCCGQ